MAVDIDQYRVIETLSANDSATVHLALKKNSGSSSEQQFIVKQIKPLAGTGYSYDSRVENAVAAHNKLQGDQRVLSLCDHGKGFLVFDNTSLCSLEDYSSSFQTTPKEKLEIALGLCHAVAAIHAVNLIHSNLHPRNIFINPISKKIAVGDLERSYNRDGKTAPSDLSREANNFVAPEILKLDESEISVQSDFFSIGKIVSYLFETNPSNVEIEIPKPILRFTKILTHQSTADRYSSLENIIRDLELYIEFLDRLGHIPEVNQDISNTTTGELEVPFVGRNGDIGVLLAAYSNIESRSHFFTLIGPRGIGKSRLFNEFLNQTHNNDYVIKASCNHKSYQTPYGLLLQLINGIIENLQQETSINSEKHKTIIQFYLHGLFNLKALSPELRQYLNLPPATSKTSDIGIAGILSDLEIFFRELPIRRIILTVDNINSGDNESLILLKRYVEEYSKLMIIGADTAIGPHPLADFLSSKDTRSQRSISRLTCIELTPLTAQDLGKVVGTLFQPGHIDTELVINRLDALTEGHPELVAYYIHQWISLGIIAPNEKGVWLCDEVQLQKSHDTSESLNNRELSLDLNEKRTQEILLVCALCEKGADRDLLLEALSKDYPIDAVIRSAIYHKKLVNIENHLHIKDPAFKSDLIRSFSQQELESINKRLGDHYYARHLNSHSDQWLELVLQHYNEAPSYFQHRQGVIEISQLNHTMACKLIEKQDWHSAYHLLNFLDKLPSYIDLWESHYSLMYDLAISKMRVCYHLGHYVEAQALFERIQELAASAVDEALACELKVKLLIAKNRYEEAVDLGIAALNKMGFSIPKSPNLFHLFSVYWKLDRQLNKVGYDKVIDLPPINEQSRAVLSLSVTVGTACFQSGMLHFPIVCMNALLYSLPHGLAPETSFHLIGFNMVKSTISTTQAEKVDQITAQILRRYPDYLTGVVADTFYKWGVINPWSNAVSQSSRNLRKGFHTAMDIGDYEFAGYLSGAYFCLRLLRPVDLAAIKKEVEDLLPAIRELSHNTAIQVHELILSTTNALMSEDQEAVSKTLLPPKDINRKYGQNQSVLFAAYLLQTLLAYYCGKYKQAVSYYYRGIIPSLKGGTTLPYHYAFHEFGLLAMARNLEGKSFLTKMISALNPAPWLILLRYKLWSNKFELNIKHKYLLMKAEWSNVLFPFKRNALATAKEAESFAAKTDFVYDRTLIAEVQAKIYKRLGQNNKARGLYQKAMALYKKNSFHLYTKHIEDQLLLTPDDPSEFPATRRKVDTEAFRNCRSEAEVFQTINLALNKHLGRLETAFIGATEKGFEIRHCSQQSEAPLSEELLTACLEDQNIILDRDRTNTSILVAPITSELITICLTLRAVEDYPLNETAFPLIKELCTAATHQLESLFLVEENRKLRLEKNDLSRAVAQMHHEIRTPLNGSVGFVKLIKDRITDLDINDNELEKYVSLLSVNTRDLERMNTDVLDYYKLDRGQLILEQQRFDPVASIEDCLRLIKPYFDIKNVTLEATDYQNVPETLLGDSTRVKQILNNLLHNALKFTGDGGSVHCQVIAEQAAVNQCDLIIRVRDSGSGIGEDKLEHLLDERDFNQQRFVSSNSGFGYGLPIATKLAKLMNGGIHIQSIPERGSDVYVKISLATPTSSESEAQAPADQIIPVYQEVTCLIVDDSLSNREIFKGALKKTNITCIEADSGIDALRCCERHTIDVILMDVWLPDMNGLDVSKEIHRRWNGITIIGSSASFFKEEQLEKVGIHHFLPKPVNINLLYDYLIDILGQPDQQLKEQGVFTPIQEEIDGIDINSLNQRLEKTNLNVFVIGLEQFLVESESIESDIKYAANNNKAGIYKNQLHKLIGQSQGFAALTLHNLCKSLYEQPVQIFDEQQLITINDFLIPEIHRAKLGASQLIERFKTDAPENKDKAESLTDELAQSFIANLNRRSLKSAKKDFLSMEHILSSTDKNSTDQIKRSISKGEFTVALETFEKIINR